MESNSSKNKLIYDPLYGFIQLTDLEWEIIHSPFYQRLRWIKQIGFSFYTFPGAEHSRFGHSIGVMYNAHKILESIGKAVSPSDFFDSTHRSKAKDYHQSVRLAALMHDLGTFCFSHTTEMAYIRYGETSSDKKSKGHPDDHEHLGSWIIKNSHQENGITAILERYGVSAQKISDLVKGVDKDILANQILHAEVDCDRMDYLLRDAHYTGLHYGKYDRDYLLHHFTLVKQQDQEILAINDNALRCVEDFLMARMAWYSQVVRSARGSKYDSLAEDLTYFLLEKKKIYSYSDLLEMVKNDPLKFYGFNDHYFMQTIHQLYLTGYFDKFPREKEIAACLLFEQSPKTLILDELQERILNQDDAQNVQRIKRLALEKVEEIKAVLKRKGGEKDWLVVDIPSKNLTYLRSKKQIVKNMKGENVFWERDPVKMVDGNGQLSLLVDLENSSMSNLQNDIYFIPNVYCSHSAYELLQREKIIT